MLAAPAVLLPPNAPPAVGGSSAAFMNLVTPGMNDPLNLNNILSYLTFNTHTVFPVPVGQ